MKAFVIGLLIGGLLCGAAIWRFRAPHEAEEPTAEDKAPPRELAQQTRDGTLFLKLDEEQQKQMGLRTAVLARAGTRLEKQAFGRVLNAAELPLQLAEISVAQVAMNGSRQVYERLNKLNTEAGTISVQKVEEAQEAMKKDEVALKSAQVKLLAAWGQGVAGRPDLDALAGQVAASEAALIRLDLPAGESPAVSQVRVAMPGAESQAVAAEVLGPAPQADPVTQSASIICLARVKAWIPGAALIGWLGGSGGEEGLGVPRSALIRHEGITFVYRRYEGEFARVPVTLLSTQGASWLVGGGGGLKAGDEVVTTGAQQLLSEELKGLSESD